MLRERKNKKEKYWLKVLKTQATEFCLVTGLHGYKYIAQSERSKVERIVWSIIVMIALGFAGVLMRIAWDYNSSRPTLTVIESTHHGIWNYPFPAVTVCNINRISLKGARKLIDKLKHSDDLSKEFLVSETRLLLELVSPGIHDYDITKNLTRLQAIFDENGYNISDIMRGLAHSCPELIFACKWKGSWIDCEKIFKLSLSADGYCCSFNYIDTLDPRVPSKIEPERVTACGYQTGLTVFVNPDPDDYLATLIGSYGTKILLHNPYDFPDHNSETKLAGMGYQMFLSILPEEIYSTTEVRDLSVKTRDCVFSDERKMKPTDDLNQRNFTFAQYTYRNCFAECRATTIKKMCKCIPFYMHQTGTRICDLSHVPCLRKHNLWWETSWPGIYMDNKFAEKSVNEFLPRPCECFPDCTLYRYPVEGSMGKINGSVPYADLAFLQKRKLRNETVVHIYFSDLVSIQYRCNAYYNWRNLFASFGGLLGLFAGFSLMSGYELIYFFVIQVIGDAFTKKKTDIAAKVSKNHRVEVKTMKRY